VKAAAIVSAILFTLFIFPFHVVSYLYLETNSGAVGFKVTLYNFIPVMRLGNKSFEKDERGGKKANFNGGGAFNVYTVFQNLCITEIIQLCVIGAETELGAYLALAQNSVTQVLYGFINNCGGRTKLKNYIVLNSDNSDIGYCAKVCGVINLLTLTKLFILYFWSKIYER